MAPPIRRRRFLLLLLLPIILAVAALPVAAASPSCKAWLVQSIPTDMPDLRRVPGVLSTADVLQWLSGNATKNLDILAQYWQLLAQPTNPKSGDYGFSESDMARFGADEGLRVYKALEKAADRKVKIRIAQNSGFAPDFDQESADLAAGRPNVQNATLLFEDWWGSGVLHAKVWISDKKDVYIGSANNDWKSLTQVKELGIYFSGCPQIAKTVEVYFQNLWTLSALSSSTYTKIAWDKQWQTFRKVPCWSHFLHPEERCRSPLPLSVDVPYVDGYPSLANPELLDVLIETPGIKRSTKERYLSYLSFAPPELSFDKFQADEQGWVDTIKSVNSGGMVRISTMDWLGQSQYALQIVFWPSLSSAISEVILSKNATVRLLVAYWTHFIPNTDNYLKSLLYSNILCASSKYNHCGGKVEIRYYVVPGYNETGPALSSQGAVTGNRYPGFTRVNHGKYAVSDTRANIGTSNLIWDYFYTTAGVSFGTYDPSIVSQLQDVFDADWDSPYTLPVTPLEVILSKNATVRLLVAYWTHFIPNTDNYLKSLLYSNILCASSKYNHCGGKVEIRYYVVPGYNETGPALSSQGAVTGNRYPGFTRVNHGKYAVSDTRANIGTSNLIWDYFYTTAGVSFGTYDPSIVSQLQDVFDADWDSPYTLPVTPLEVSV